MDMDKLMGFEILNRTNTHKVKQIKIHIIIIIDYYGCECFKEKIIKCHMVISMFQVITDVPSLP